MNKQILFILAIIFFIGYNHLSAKNVPSYIPIETTAVAELTVNNTCALTFPFPGFPIDFKNTGADWIDYDLGSDFLLTANTDSTMTISGLITNAQAVDFGSGSNSIPCGVDDEWQVDLFISAKKTYAEWQGMGGSAHMHANCVGLEGGLEYWNISGTLTGLGCNTGRTVNILEPQSPYQLQIGTGAMYTDGACGFTMATWFNAIENGQTIKADIYAAVDETCYNGLFNQPTIRVDAYALTVSCTNSMPNNDGYLQISDAANATHYNYIIGSDYSAGDTDIANATAFNIATDLPLQFGSLSNPTGVQDYTIRVFNGASDCFIDVTVTMKEQDCTVGCSCVEYVYLNDISLDLVHKFKVSPDGSLIEVGDPWLAAGIINNPHGLGVDLNGRIFIGQADNFDGGAPNGPIFKLDCDGQVIESDMLNPETTYGYNFFSRNSILYTFNNTNPKQVKAYDLCDGSYLGGMQTTEAGPYGTFWGMYIDDENWYLADRGNGRVLTGPLDISLYSDPSTHHGEVLFNITNMTFGQPLGITRDSNGNFYIVETLQANPQEVTIHKYDQDGNHLTSVNDNNMGGANANDGMDGFFSGRGLTYSESANVIYFGNRENCITVFDTNLVQQTTLNMGNPSDGAPKGVVISNECCPINNNISIDTALCAAQLNDKLFLQEMINCTGTICEGTWTADVANTGLTYESCDNSVTIDDWSACGTFTLDSDGTGNNPQCGAFTIELNISVNTLDLTVNQVGCVDNLDGTFTANYDVVIDWNSIPCKTGDVINVTQNGNAIGLIDPSTDTSPSTFPATSAADGNGVQLFVATYALAGCTDSMQINTPNCILPYDVAITKTVDQNEPNLNDTITFTLVVANNEAAVTGVEVTDVLPTGLTYANTYNASVGTFDGTSWTIGNMAVGASDTIDIDVVVVEEGIQNNIATVAINETETDTTNNEDQVCISVPIEICDDGSQSIDATALDVNGDGSTTYRWYISTDNGATYDSIPANNGGTAQTYNIIQAAYYTYVVNDGDLGNCGGQLCCPIIVETMTCAVCPPKNCIPIQIEQTN